jgi:hypothetical protein
VRAVRGLVYQACATRHDVGMTERTWPAAQLRAEFANFNRHARPVRAGDPSYRTIKGILAVGAKTDPIPPTTGGGAAAHLHGPTRLFATVIAARHEPVRHRSGRLVDLPIGPNASQIIGEGRRPSRR